jgi:ketosteroid isomerase-like protein
MRATAGGRGTAALLGKQRSAERYSALVEEDENIVIVRHAIRHLNETGEPDWELYDPELIWTTRPDGPAHITYRGLDGLRQGIRSMHSVWAEFKAEIEEVTASEDRVVLVIRWHLRAQSGVELEEVEGWASWLRDGKITRIEQHGSKEEALSAAGLME